jgi:hypothetical protein
MCYFICYNDDVLCQHRPLRQTDEEWSPGLVGALRGVQTTMDSHLQFVGTLRETANDEAWFPRRISVAEFLANPSNKPASIVPWTVAACSASLCNIS